MILKTKTKEFDIIWDGVSDLDGLLRVQIAGSTISELLTTFMDSEETETLNVCDSSAVIRTYSGYAEFYGIAKNDRGFIISLGKGAVE